MRLLIERVEVTVQGTTEQVDVSIHWSGGFVSRHEVLRPVNRYEQTADYERLISRINELCKEKKSYSEIAEHLNKEGFQPAKQARAYNKTIVRRLVKKIHPDSPAARKNTTQARLEENEWIVRTLADRIDIPRTTLMSWIKRGWVHVSRQLPGYRGQIICGANADELDRLRQLRKTKRYLGNPPLPTELTTPKVPPRSLS